MKTTSEIRHASHPNDAKNYDTERLRKEFLVSNLFRANEIYMVYSSYDRFIVGGIVPVEESIELKPIDELKAEYFLQRREMGIINIGGSGSVIIDGITFDLNYKEALYIGKGNKNIQFQSKEKLKPAKFYFNSTPAHHEYPIKKVTLAEASVAEMGAAETSNARKINKLLVNQVLPTCQLQMGMTELKTGSVWNTMPAHTHSRRMEVYLYFNLPDNQAVCHFMGEPQETRHIWMKNEEAVISPNWSIHSACATASYTFIWGMAGENLDYSDMDVCTPDLLR